MRRAHIPAPAEEFGYPAEGGAEFVHGAAPVTRALMREAGLALLPRRGHAMEPARVCCRPTSVASARRAVSTGRCRRWKPICRSPSSWRGILPTREYDRLRRSITRTVEGYDAADPQRISTLALRDEWMARDDGEHGRIAEGYGALVAYLAAECRRHGAVIHLGAAVAGDRESGAAGLPCAAATAPYSRPMLQS